MRYAYSLSLSRIIDACDLMNSGKHFTDLFGYAERQYVCPECFQPVFPRAKSSAVVASHFSHFEKNPKSPDCIVRTTGVDVSNLSRSQTLVQRLEKYFSKSEFSLAYLCCASAYILNSLSSIVAKKSPGLSGKLSSVRIDQVNHIVYFDFSESVSSIYYSPSLSLEQLVRSPSINILSQISRLIFPENIDQDLPLTSAACGQLLSPLIRDLFSSNTIGVIDRFVISEEERSILHRFAYTNIISTSRFKSLRDLLILAGLIEAFLRYSPDSSCNLCDTGLSVNILPEKRISSLPFPVKKSLLAFLTLLCDEDSHFEQNCAKLLLDASTLKPIRDRALRFMNLLEFDSLDSNHLEKALCTVSGDKVGFIYIAHSSDLNKIYDMKSVVKIGRSINPFKREIDLTGQMLKEPVSIKRVFHVRDQVLAESTIFNALSKYRVMSSREIFSLSIERAAELISSCLVKADLVFAR